MSRGYFSVPLGQVSMPGDPKPGEPGWCPNAKNKAKGKKRGCSMCGNTVFVIWRVRRLPGYSEIRGADGEVWRKATLPETHYHLMCIDRERCFERRNAQYKRQQAQAEKRRGGPLPHAGAGPGHCAWCGEEIKFDESKKGWKRRRSRGYHRGDEWELKDFGDEPSCLYMALAWTTPRRALGHLLDRTDGRCAACGFEVADKATEDGFHPEYGDWIVRRAGPEERFATQAEVDHILPIEDGGTNHIENLQPLCPPCHRGKSAKEAKDRAARRRKARRQTRV